MIERLSELIVMGLAAIVIAGIYAKARYDQSKRNKV